LDGIQLVFVATKAQSDMAEKTEKDAKTGKDKPVKIKEMLGKVF
jgi:hypothetical protein